MSVACCDAFSSASPVCADTQHQKMPHHHTSAHNNNNNNNTLFDGASLEELQRALSAPQCPLSARCQLENGECVLDHVKRVHRVPECDVEVDAAGMGVVEMEIDVPSRLQKRTQYSAMLLKFEGLFFLWTLESRLRADAETQVSAVVQIIKQGSGGGGGNSPVDARSRAATLPSNTNSASSSGAGSPVSHHELSDLVLMLDADSYHQNRQSHSSRRNGGLQLEIGGGVGGEVTPPSNKSFRVAVSIDVPGQTTSPSQVPFAPGTGSAAAAHQRPPVMIGSPPCAAANNQRPPLLFGASDNLGSSSSDLLTSPRWSTTLVDDICSTPRRHERLISHGQGLVALWPTHSYLFSTASKPDMMQLAVRTMIERL